MTNRYRYTECGLDYVHLANGYTVHDTPYGSGVSIEDVDGLHKAIAIYIVSSASRLRGQEVRFLRAQLDLSQQALASILKTTRATVARYEGRPDKDIPGQADTALRLFYAAASGGNRTAERIVELLRKADEAGHGDAVFRETQHGWIRAAA